MWKFNLLGPTLWGRHCIQGRCPDVDDPDAFGFTPWYDRAAGYYVILGMELDSTGDDEGIVQFAVTLQTEMAPLITRVITGAGP